MSYKKKRLLESTIEKKIKYLVSANCNDNKLDISVVA